MPYTPPLRVRVELLALDPEGDLAYLVAFLSGRMILYTMVRDDDGEWCRG
jgi:hypothetical protein